MGDKILKESHTCVSTMISQYHIKLRYDVIGTNVIAIVKNYAIVSVPTFIAHIKQLYNYTTTYKKAWPAKQWTIKHEYGISEQSYEDLPKFLLALQTFVPKTIF